MAQSRDELLRKKREYAKRVREALSREARDIANAQARAYYAKNADKMRAACRTKNRKRYWANLEEWRRIKRQSAAREYARNSGRVRARNKASRERAKAANPSGFGARVKAYNAKYIQKNPENRKRSVRAYYAANRDACITACAASHRRRKQTDPVFALTVAIRNRFGGVLQRARCAPTTDEAKQIHKWFEWLRERGHADWKMKGIEIDHVIPVSRFNITAEGSARAINNWRNLFPIPANENRAKCARIIPSYIRHVWALADEFLTNERPARVA